MISNFVVLGVRAIPAGRDTPPAQDKRLPVLDRNLHLDSQKARGRKRKNTDMPGIKNAKGGAESGSEDDDLDVQPKGNTGGIHSCGCGALLDGHECVLKTFPLNRLELEELFESNHYVTKSSVSSLTAGNKRFLHYYWYATNIFLYHGKGNRVELPHCVVDAIREKYPEKGGNYKGFKISDAGDEEGDRVFI